MDSMEEVDLVGADDLHDSILTNMQLEADNVDLEFRLADGRTYRVGLRGVRHLLGSDLGESNIVREFVTISGPTTRERIRRLTIGARDVPNLIGARRDSAYGRRLFAALEQEELTLVVIMPTLGMQMLAICQEVECLPVEVMR